MRWGGVVVVVGGLWLWVWLVGWWQWMNEFQCSILLMVWNPLDNKENTMTNLEMMNIKANGITYINAATDW